MVDAADRDEVTLLLPDQGTLGRLKNRRIREPSRGSPKRPTHLNLLTLLHRNRATHLLFLDSTLLVGDRPALLPVSKKRIAPWDEQKEEAEIEKLLIIHSAFVLENSLALFFPDVVVLHSAASLARPVGHGQPRESLTPNVGQTQEKWA